MDSKEHIKYTLIYVHADSITGTFCRMEKSVTMLRLHVHDRGTQWL